MLTKHQLTHTRVHAAKFFADVAKGKLSPKFLPSLSEVDSAEFRYVPLYVNGQVEFRITPL